MEQQKFYLVTCTGCGCIYQVSTGTKLYVIREKEVPAELHEPLYPVPLTDDKICPLCEMSELIVQDIAPNDLSEFSTEYAKVFMPFIDYKKAIAWQLPIALYQEMTPAQQDKEKLRIAACMGTVIDHIAGHLASKLFPTSAPLDFIPNIAIEFFNEHMQTDFAALLSETILYNSWVDYVRYYANRKALEYNDVPEKK